MEPYIRLKIREIPRIKGFDRLESFRRRVDEDYIVPQGNINDSFVEEEGLYSCAVIPKYSVNRKITVVYKTGVIVDCEKELEEIRGIEQVCMERYLIPSKGRSYYGENKYYMGDESPDGLYPTLIFSDGLIGKSVIIII